MPVMRIADLIAALCRIYAPRFATIPPRSRSGDRLLPGEKLYEALMTPEEALHATEAADHFRVEPLQPVRPSGWSSARGYDSEHSR